MSVAPSSSAPWYRRPWLGVLSRSLAAIFGGYALASTSSLLLALALPIAPSQAVLTGMLLGVLVGAGAALWAFAASSAVRAWAGIALPALLMYALIAWLRQGAA